MKKVIVTLLVVLCFAMNLVAISSLAVEKQNLFWSATSPTSGYYPFNVACAEIINKNVPSLQITVLESGGGAENLDLVESGQASFGQSSTIGTFVAQKGIGIHEGKPYEKVRELFVPFLSGYFFVVRANTGITTLSQLDGQEYNAGLPGSNTELLSISILEDILGYHPQWVPAGTSEAVNNMKDRRIVGLTRSASAKIPDSALQDIATAVDIRVLSFTDEEIAKVMEVYPYYRFTNVDPSIYKQDEPIKTLAAGFSVIVSTDLSEDVVYEVAKVLFENQDYLGQSYAGIKGADMAGLTLDYSTSYLHPGTIKYLKEKGYTIREEQIPPEFKK